MTPQQAKELLPVIQAFSEGKAVQVKYNDEWRDAKSPAFNTVGEYRIKPEKKSPGELLYTSSPSRRRGDVPWKSLSKDYRAFFESYAEEFLKLYNEQESQS